MANFEVKVRKIEVIDHPNADLLEIAKVGDFLSIIPKGQYKTGDNIVYIPENSVLPENIIEEMNLKGKLSTADKNVLKAVRLRGIFSQGLVYPNKNNHPENYDVKEELGIEKYEMSVPLHFAGEISFAGDEYTMNYDIENIKKYPEVIKEGEEVQMTEKLHGTFSMFSVAPKGENNEKLIQGRYGISSKGHSHKGLVFKDNENNSRNIYVKTAKELNLFAILDKLSENFNDVVFVAGEIFGARVQDLSYGFTKRAEFRVFDIAIGRERYKRRFLNHEELEEVCKEFGLKRVPILYVGKFSKEVLDKYTNGKETISGKESHVREGVVIKPKIERYDFELGRVLLKSVSEKYILRKNGTEFN